MLPTALPYVNSLISGFCNIPFDCLIHTLKTKARLLKRHVISRILLFGSFLITLQPHFYKFWKNLAKLTFLINHFKTNHPVSIIVYSSKSSLTVCAYIDLIFDIQHSFCNKLLNPHHLLNNPTPVKLPLSISSIAGGHLIGIELYFIWLNSRIIWVFKSRN